MNLEKLVQGCTGAHDEDDTQAALLITPAMAQAERQAQVIEAITSQLCDPTTLQNGVNVPVMDFDAPALIKHFTDLGWGVLYNKTIPSAPSNGGFLSVYFPGTSNQN